MKNEIKTDKDVMAGAWILGAIFGGLMGWMFSLFTPTAVASLLGFVFCLGFVCLIALALHKAEKNKQKRREEGEREEAERCSRKLDDDSR